MSKSGFKLRLIKFQRYVFPSTILFHYNLYSRHKKLWFSPNTPFSSHHSNSPQHLLFPLLFPLFVKSFLVGKSIRNFMGVLCVLSFSTVHMIDGCPEATSLSLETYLADVQVERFFRSFLIHHPFTINHNYLSGSHHVRKGSALCKWSVIKETVKEMYVRINDNKNRMCRMAPLSVSSLGTPRTI